VCGCVGGGGGELDVFLFFSSNLKYSCVCARVHVEPSDFTCTPVLARLYVYTVCVCVCVCVCVRDSCTPGKEVRVRSRAAAPGDTESPVV